MKTTTHHKSTIPSTGNTVSPLPPNLPKILFIRAPSLSSNSHHESFPIFHKGKCISLPVESTVKPYHRSIICVNLSVFSLKFRVPKCSGSLIHLRRSRTKPRGFLSLITENPGQRSHLGQVTYNKSERSINVRRKINVENTNMRRWCYFGSYWLLFSKLVSMNNF